MSQLIVFTSPDEALLSKLRGYLVLLFVGIFFVTWEIIQRTVISLGVKLFPSKRHVLLGLWQRYIARTIVGLIDKVGGAEVGELPRLPTEPGVLILMNHQSVLDIPLAVASMKDNYPLVVTRARYARGKPLISHMIRLYQYPLVDPKATTKGHLRALEQTGLESEVPILLFPEGTRTRDGSVGNWRRGALERLLKARSWDVYVVVADGLWRAARAQDFIDNISTSHPKVTCLGPVRSPEPGEPIEAFVAQMKEMMEEGLESLRGSAPV